MSVAKRQPVSAPALDTRSSGRMARTAAATVGRTVPVSETLVVDDLTLAVRWSDRRQTVGLTVERDGHLVISAPVGCSSDVLEGFEREKRFWLFTKLSEKEVLREEIQPRQFVGGEGFPYLGRSYRLRLVDELDVPLKLMHGRFVLRRRDADDGRSVLVAWYTARAKRWLDERVGRFTARLGQEPSSIAVRDLGFRWGSCGRSGQLSFHWAAILLPPALIDYVIVHELAHLVEAKHTPRFWRTVERAMPDYEARRARLAELGHGCASLL